MEVKIPILIKRKLKDKIDWLSTNYENEIGGWITGEINKEGIVLDDLLIPEQEVGGAHVNMDGKQIAKLRKEFGKKCERIICEWHSHNFIGSFWSNIDEKLINQLMGPRKAFLFIVSSEGNHKIRLELRNPYFISIDDMEYSVEENSSISKSLLKEIKKKVIENKFSYSGHGYNSTQNTESFYDNPIWSEGIETQAKKYDIDDEIKAKIKRIMRFNDTDNSITVSDLPWYYADSLMQEFQDYSPEMISMGDSIHYSIKLVTENKGKAIDLMKDLKEWLAMILDEEIRCKMI